MGIELPHAWVEQHWEERGFTDAEWATFLKVYAILHHRLSKSSPQMNTMYKEIKKKNLRKVIADRASMVLAGTGIRRMRAMPVEEQHVLGEELQQLVNKAGDAGLRRPASAPMTEPFTKEPCQTETDMKCHGCSVHTKEVHFFYDKMCLECGAHNWEHRTRHRDLTGKVALVTGGRIKIGYQIVLKLLRCGATVHTTTRFPVDAAQRYAKEPDFPAWKSRLHVRGPLDFLDLRGLNEFVEGLEQELPRLDILVNNAAQTIARPNRFYLNLLPGEVTRPSDMATDVAALLSPVQHLPEGVTWFDTHHVDTADMILPPQTEPEPLRPCLVVEEVGCVAETSTPPGEGSPCPVIEEPEDDEGEEGVEEIEAEPQREPGTLKPEPEAAKGDVRTDVPWSLGEVLPACAQNAFGEGEGSNEVVLREHFPEGEADVYGQQIDLRPENTWVSKIDKVAVGELLQTHAVNAMAPFILVQKLKPLLARSGEECNEAYVVNVSAREGKFSKAYNSMNHPHTNMAKASLNMLTRTSADDYADSAIFMNSVDTGWVTHETPLVDHWKHTGRMDEQFEPPLDELDGAMRVLDPVLNGRNEYGKYLEDYLHSDW